MGLRDFSGSPSGERSNQFARSCRVSGMPTGGQRALPPSQISDSQQSPAWQCRDDGKGPSMPMRGLLLDASDSVKRSLESGEFSYVEDPSEMLSGDGRQLRGVPQMFPPTSPDGHTASACSHPETDRTSCGMSSGGLEATCGEETDPHAVLSDSELSEPTSPQFPFMGQGDSWMHQGEGKMDQSGAAGDDSQEALAKRTGAAEARNIAVLRYMEKKKHRT